MTISGTLGIVGLLVSITSALLGGVDFPDFIIKPIVSAIALATLGVGISFLLESQVPVFFEVSDDEEYSKKNSYSQDADQVEIGDIPEESKDIKNDLPSEVEKDHTLDYQVDMEGRESLGGRPNKRNTVPREGEIVVEGVTFKNEPETMAEAIRTLLDQDKEPSKI